MPTPPARPTFFAAVSAIAQIVETDPRVQSTLEILDRAGLSATARVVREVMAKAPDLAEGAVSAAVAGLRAEAGVIDRTLARSISGAVDLALVRRGARAPKTKRLSQGGKSRARQAARQGKSKR